ncbi:hypothetical protein C1T31_10460 [Hanstruepera neustonica]|uniref:DUF2971 domain-containing protein n=1 Tax=Hanstruepera neustonica TaxID=1445657 RepID=A0A2K1DX42_9FLAO|nr:DUF2971 domain-containing protein [Hanstruepera neustonica]PNQ72569.1 hypothetical protein C1T31_10460 [Hanstruepera neustonica]
MNKLYKYYSINNLSVASLTNGYCWYSNPNSFNDPFDTKIIQCELLQDLSFSKEKILCLSAINDNLLMWAHYTQSHKGFCIEFSDHTDEELVKLKSKGIFPNESNDKLSIVRNAREVEYKSTEEIEEYIADIPSTNDEFLKLYHNLDVEKQAALIKKIQKTSFIKHKDWSYEKEYRIINTSRNLIRFPGNISGVFFGMNMSSIEKRMIGMILSPDLKNRIKFYQMYRPHNKYSLKYRDFDLKKDLPDFGESLIA